MPPSWTLDAGARDNCRRLAARRKRRGFRGTTRAPFDVGAPPGDPAVTVRAWLASPRVATWLLVVLAGALFVGNLSNAGATPRPAAPVTATPVAPGETTPTTTSPPTTTRAPDPAPSQGLQQPPPAVLPPLPAGGLGQGDTGDVVKAYQDRMYQVRLDPGPRDGVFREDTTYAIDTLQRLMHVTVTGRIGPDEASFLAGFHYPEPLHPDAEPEHPMHV